jgi:hypothetical protein
MASTSPDSSAASNATAPGQAAPGEAAVASAPTRPAIYFDGVTNRRHVVVLRFGSTLELIEDGAAVATWPYADLRAVDGGPGMLRLKCVSALPLARLEVPDPAAQVEIGMTRRRGANRPHRRLVARRRRLDRADSACRSRPSG